MNMERNTEIKAKAEAWAARHHHEVVGGPYNDRFVIRHQDGTFRVGRVQLAARKVKLYNMRFASAPGGEEALRVGKTGSKPRNQTEARPVKSDQQVVDEFCRKTGMKASDDMYGDYCVVSQPIGNAKRRWCVAKREGDELRIDRDNMTDRWAARSTAQKLGGPTATGMLSGPHMWPYGGQFRKPVAPPATTARDTTKDGHRAA